MALLSKRSHCAAA